jgi:thiosulfate/3-mercaptopyruvate sulfurtransferase
MKRLLAALLFTLLAPGAFGAGLIVDAAFVAAAAQRGAVIWDARDVFSYRRGHIPGAVTIGNAAHVLRNANTEDFIAVAEIERILGGAGIDPSNEVIVYAERGNPLAYFAHYTMRYFGGKRAYVYHDGIDGWRAAGHPLSTTERRLPPVALKLQVRPEVAASTQEVIAAAQRRDVQLVDARTVEEYRGEDIRAIRGGHIPGALNIPYEQNWVDPDTGEKLARRQVRDTLGMALKGTEELKRLYSALDPAKETIVYCQSGVRAAQTAVVLEQLGFRNVKVYDASWLGYAGVLSAPAANETFFNVGRMNARLSQMQARIEQLERELAETRAKK